MKSRVVIRSKAAADIDEAQRWYERARAGLGDEFLDMLDGVIDQIARNPYSHAPIHRDVRRASLRRFPYGVFYRVLDEVVFVVAVFHGRRSLARLKRRK